MRHHFHRCGHLRVIDLDVRDRSGARKGGKQILDELCEARRLAPCVGLAECEILSAGQKRDLLVARATQLREEDGGVSTLADAEDPRAAELAELREALLEERDAIVEENRRRAAEAGGGLRRNPRPISLSEERELAGAGVSVVQDDELRELRTARLDALDRALDALAHGGFGECARCGGAIAVGQLQEAPDSVVCAPCAKLALPTIERRML